MKLAHTPFIRLKETWRYIPPSKYCIYTTITPTSRTCSRTTTTPQSSHKRRLVHWSWVMVGSAPHTATNKRVLHSLESKQTKQRVGNVRHDTQRPLQRCAAVITRCAFSDQIHKGKEELHLFSGKNDAKAVFRFLYATLCFKCLKPPSILLLAHMNALKKFTTVALITFTLSTGSESLSMNNAVLGTLMKRLIAVVKKGDFLGSVPTNPRNFRHFSLNCFIQYVKGRQIPSNGLSLQTRYEKIRPLYVEHFFSTLAFIV